MYRKIIALVLVFVMMLGIVGCRKKNQNSDLNGPGATSENAKTESDSKPSDGDITAPTAPEETTPKATLGDNIDISVGVVESPEEDEELDELTDSTTATTQPGNEKTDPAKPSDEGTEPTSPSVEEPDPTEPNGDGPGEEDTIPTIPEGEEPEFTEPGKEEIEPTPIDPSGDIPTAEDYEWYNSLSGAEQYAFIQTFSPNLSRFTTWLNAAKQAYMDLYPDEEIGEGPVDGGNIG